MTKTTKKRMKAKLIKFPPEMIDDIQWLAEFIADISYEKPNFSSTVRGLLHESLKRQLANSERGAKYRSSGGSRKK